MEFQMGKDFKGDPKPKLSGIGGAMDNIKPFMIHADDIEGSKKLTNPENMLIITDQMASNVRACGAETNRLKRKSPENVDSSTSSRLLKVCRRPGSNFGSAKKYCKKGHSEASSPGLPLFYPFTLCTVLRNLQLSLYKMDKVAFVNNHHKI